jgi:hypothetical protein
MGDFITYDDAQAALFKPLTELDVNDKSLYIEPVKKGKVRVHSRRRFYVDATGDRKTIDPSIYENQRSGEFSFHNDTNTIKTEVRSEGEVWIRLKGYSVRVRLESEQAESDLGAVQDSTAAVKPKTENPEPNKVKVTDAVGSNLEFDYEVQPGGLKETITVHAKPKLGTSKTWAIVWDWAAEGLTPAISGDRQRIEWKDTRGETRLVFRSLNVWDAEDATIVAQYRIDGRKIAVVLSSRDMDKATYPVTIDPTYTTDDTEATDSLRITEANYNPGRGYYRGFVKFTLPDLSGSTVTGATFNYYAYYSVGTPPTWDVYCAVPSQAWTSSSGVSTMGTVAGQMGAITDADETRSGTGWTQSDVSGSVGNDGLVDIYNSDSSPDPCTVMIEWNSFSDGTPVPDDSDSGAFVIGEINDRFSFRGYDDATNYPYLEIDYTSGGGVTVPVMFHHYNTLRSAS